MSPIDTAKERRQAEGGQEPAPDGTIDAQDRATAAGEYPAGIAGSSGSSSGIGFRIFGDGDFFTIKRN